MEPARVISLNIEKLMRTGMWWNAGLLVLFAFLYHFFTEPLTFNFSWSGIGLFIVGYVLLIVLHELFHLIGFVVFGRVPLSSLAYGLNLKMGVAYATTERPLRIGAMRKALLLPFWMTGVLPGIIGFTLPNQVLVLLSAILIAGAIGDFSMYRGLRNVKTSAWVMDDKTEPKLYVYDDYPDE
ncbi:DUF3267 domain-containing protein [Indiicoccus explosivorum]|uniref:DUF3267 domain-containing protein n=1 Tax=Indiicoccus explosivorum TaxID=1917864 RepID=UPI000B44472D|nr:DUF3267 domain-containing protein [Indiicoccus explosivorum]